MKNLSLSEEYKDLVDFIVWTGDDLSHAPEEVFTKQETLETIETISRELSQLNLPVYPSLGNHDIIPKNQVSSIHVNVVFNKKHTFSIQLISGLSIINLLLIFGEEAFLTMMKISGPSLERIVSLLELVTFFYKIFSIFQVDSTLLMYLSL